MRRPISLCLALLFFVLLATSCTTTPPLVQQLPETFKAACDLYSKAKPDVLAMREWTKAHWETVPADIKPTLVKLDGYLPALDKGGLLVCDLADQTSAIHAQPDGSINWDDVLSVVLKSVSLAIDLKQQGKI